MSKKERKSRWRFHAHETARVDSLDGRLLATFWRRLAAFVVDVVVATVLFAPVEYSWQRYVLRSLHLLREWKDTREVDDPNTGHQLDAGAGVALAGDGTGAGVWRFGAGGWLWISAVLHQSQPAVRA
jgi:hypothetical protein